MAIGTSTALLIAAAATAASAYVSYEQGNKQADAQKNAMAQAADNAKKQADAADQANNRANAKRPDVAGMMAANMLSAKGGQGGTMLTGPAGADVSAGMLGRNTLLGA